MLTSLFTLIILSQLVGKIGAGHLQSTMPPLTSTKAHRRSLSPLKRGPHSPKLEGNFSSYAGLKFDIAGAQPDLFLYFADSSAGVSSPSIAQL